MLNTSRRPWQDTCRLNGLMTSMLNHRRQASRREGQGSSEARVSAERSPTRCHVSLMVIGSWSASKPRIEALTEES